MVAKGDRLHRTEHENSLLSSSASSSSATSSCSSTGASICNGIEIKSLLLSILLLGCILVMAESMVRYMSASTVCNSLISTRGHAYQELNEVYAKSSKGNIMEEMKAVEEEIKEESKEVVMKRQRLQDIIGGGDINRRVDTADGDKSSDNIRRKGNREDDDGSSKGDNIKRSKGMADSDSGRKEYRADDSGSKSRQDMADGDYNGRKENIRSTDGEDDHKEYMADGVQVIKRGFRGYGSAASVFVEFGTYRGGDDSFAIVGLASKPLHVYGRPGFRCEYLPANGSAPAVAGAARKMLPDWGYGRVYTVVVVNCSFPHAVGVPAGGQLILHATGGSGSHDTWQRVVALTEAPADVAAATSTYRAARPPYDFAYCGSSLYGDINPDRLREWLAYHVRLLGPRAHFFLHDAAGLHPRVRRALAPWQRLGYVTLHDIRAQSQYDTYYYNQFLVVNDCLHRTRHLANWTFFFDVDEYLYVPPADTLHNVMASFSNYTQITFEQSPMSPKLCRAPSKHHHSRQWGFEMLIYRNVKRGFRWDRKYAIQPSNAFATGVHMSENIVGSTLHTRGPRIKYYHYHNTITKHGELCEYFVNTTSKTTTIYSDNDPFQLDTGLQYFAQIVKDFEVQQIGNNSHY